MTMLTKFYIEALLVVSVLADEIWLDWNSGVIDMPTALTAWMAGIRKIMETPLETRVKRAAARNCETVGIIGRDEKI